MQRLFLALDLPDDIKDGLLPFQPGPGAGLRPVHRAGLHLTLCFIGVADIEQVHQAVSTLRAREFSIRINGVGFYRHARGGVLWAGVEASETLLALRESLSVTLRQAGIPSDTRRFRPHITLARCKRGASTARLARLLRQGEQLLLGPVRIQQFVLFSSDTRPDGARYRAERTYPLARKGKTDPHDPGK